MGKVSRKGYGFAGSIYTPVEETDTENKLKRLMKRVSMEKL